MPRPGEESTLPEGIDPNVFVKRRDVEFGDLKTIRFPLRMRLRWKCRAAMSAVRRFFALPFLRELHGEDFFTEYQAVILGLEEDGNR